MEILLHDELCILDLQLTYEMMFDDWPDLVHIIDEQKIQLSLIQDVQLHDLQLLHVTKRLHSEDLDDEDQINVEMEFVEVQKNVMMEMLSMEMDVIVIVK